MSESKSAAVAAVVAAIFGAAGVIGAGYYGFGELRSMLASSHAETRGVIVELQTETLEEIRKLESGGIGSGEGAGAVSASLDALASELKAVRMEQQTIADKLSALSNSEHDMPETVVVPGDHYAREIYFPLAVYKGEEIDKQIDDALPDIRGFMGDKACTATVSGYSDTIGNDSANLNISRERAQYVADKLKDQGIEIGDVTGWGERRLEIHTGDGVMMDKNRRVEIAVECAKEPMATTGGETS